MKIKSILATVLCLFCVLALTPAISTAQEKDQVADSERGFLGVQFKSENGKLIVVKAVSYTHLTLPTTPYV